MKPNQLLILLFVSFSVLIFQNAFGVEEKERIRSHQGQSLQGIFPLLLPLLDESESVPLLFEPGISEPEPSNPPPAISVATGRTILLEAESSDPAGDWTEETTDIGQSGASYYRWNGGNSMDSVPKKSVLTYEFHTPTRGYYRVETRGRRDREACPCSLNDGYCGDECNDVYIRVKGTWYKKMVLDGHQHWNKWRWSSNYQQAGIDGVTQMDVPFAAGNNTIKISGRSEGVFFDGIRIIPLKHYQDGDLISAHFDFKTDPDDMIACALVKVIASEEKMSIWPVGGAYGIQSGKILSGYSKVMNAVYGTGNWQDAHRKRTSAISATVARWIQTLDAGGDIWVAEGGQHDFTSEVLDAVRLRRSNLKTSSRIHVVQHSFWNTSHSDASKLANVKTHTDFIMIADGNIGTGSGDQKSFTADLHNNNRTLYDSFYKAATEHEIYGKLFTTVFSIYDPIKYVKPYEIDGSDAVEVLYIKGVTTFAVNDLNGFMTRYLQ